MRLGRYESPTRLGGENTTHGEISGLFCGDVEFRRIGRIDQLVETRVEIRISEQAILVNPSVFEGHTSLCGSADQSLFFVDRVVYFQLFSHPSTLIRLEARTLIIGAYHRVEAEPIRPLDLNAAIAGDAQPYCAGGLYIVGLYLNRPENALVLCVDAKSSMQALERTQPLLPLSAKKPRSWTDEYVRHGTQNFAGRLRRLPPAR